MEMVLQFLKKVELPYGPAILILGISPGILKTYVHTKNFYTDVHYSAIHSNSKVETTQMSITWWMYIHTIEYYSAVKVARTDRSLQHGKNLKTLCQVKEVRCERAYAV